ncbi:EARP-interacting protein homolog isoform X3 [Betta splendens]|uniref:EARP-interacting protein homolog isoform X3 n=1 Tax=Betta splendens TaxID=158456 RepID=A0A9W2XJ76_BETSP|nr:EARP-interacting protein homolog isoform X3 [Betta splendens]
MEDDAPVIYGLEFQARALTAQAAETDAIRFLVGTQSLKFDNQIHIIDFDDENNIINKNVLLHQAGEIWHIGASPADKSVLTTCYNKTSDSRVLSCAAVWKMPSDWEMGSHESSDDSAHNPQALELLCRLDDTTHGNAACVLWEPMGDGKRVISLADNHALLWDLQESSTQATVSNIASLEGKGQLRFTSGKWSPHHNCSQLATANDTAIRGWDLRTMRLVHPSYRNARRLLLKLRHHCGQMATLYNSCCTSPQEQSHVKAVKDDLTKKLVARDLQKILLSDYEANISQTSIRYARRRLGWKFTKTEFCPMIRKHHKEV